MRTFFSIALLLAVSLAPAFGADSISAVLIGPKAIQALVEQRLFTQKGRWYLLDEGACFGYLESPRTRLSKGRLFLDAHLSSRLGVPAFGECQGPEFASDVALSTAVRAQGASIVFEDIRIEKIQDSNMAAAVDLLRSTAPGAIPKNLRFDLDKLFAEQPTDIAGVTVSLKNLQVDSIEVTPEGITVRLVLSLSST